MLQELCPDPRDNTPEIMQYNGRMRVEMKPPDVIRTGLFFHDVPDHRMGIMVGKERVVLACKQQIIADNIVHALGATLVTSKELQRRKVLLEKFYCQHDHTKVIQDLSHALLKRVHQVAESTILARLDWTKLNRTLKRKYGRAAEESALAIATDPAPPRTPPTLTSLTSTGASVYSSYYTV